MVILGNERGKWAGAYGSCWWGNPKWGKWSINGGGRNLEDNMNMVYYDHTHFLKWPIPLPNWQMGHPKFSLLTEMQLKLNSINTLHVKQQHNVGFFLFNFTLKFMLGNVYINEIHARQCLHIISLYCRKGFPHPFNLFVVSKAKESFTSNFKTARKKRFFNGTTSNWFL